jgi:hypothetical protein
MPLSLVLPDAGQAHVAQAGGDILLVALPGQVEDVLHRQALEVRLIPETRAGVPGQPAQITQSPGHRQQTPMHQVPEKEALAVSLNESPVHIEDGDYATHATSRNQNEGSGASPIKNHPCFLPVVK